MPTSSPKKLAKIARKEIKKTMLPMAQAEAEKLKIIQRKRPKWLPKFIYYWLSDQIISFVDNEAWTKRIWYSYQCENCGQFSEERYKANHAERRFDPVHNCSSTDKILISRSRLQELTRMAQKETDDLQAKGELPVFTGKKIEINKD